MVTVYIGAGLANRMFQYAFALKLKSLGYNVDIDEHTFKPRYNFEGLNLRDVFENIDLKESCPSKFKYAINDGYLAKLYRKGSEFLPNFRYIERWNLRYDPNIYYKATKDCIYVGFWISYKYFEDCKNDILSAFKFKQFVDLNNLNILKEINDSESVSVHFRKNVDYLKNLPNACPPDYYYKSISEIRKRVKNPKFFFFSDNWDWVRENIKGIVYTPIDWNPSYGPNSYYDMQLMSCCKHNIIANSTYSWWAAYLNNNHGKIVCAPYSWFGKMDINDVVPKEWLKEQVDF